MSENVKRRDFLGMALGGVAAVGAAASLYAMKRSWDPLPSVVSAGFTTVDLSGLQEGQRGRNGAVGEDDAHDQQDARHGEVHQRLNDGLRKHLQGALDLGLLLRHAKLLSLAPGPQWWCGTGEL